MVRLSQDQHRWLSYSYDDGWIVVPEADRQIPACCVDCHSEEGLSPICCLGNLLSQFTGQILSERHHLVLKMGMELTAYFGKFAKDVGCRSDGGGRTLGLVLSRRLELCKKVLKHLAQIVPGTTPIYAKALGNYNDAKLQYDKFKMESGEITREEFLKELKNSVKVGTLAKKILNF